MSISQALLDVELTNTFEEWRVETNKALAVLRESSDDDPLSSLVSTTNTGRVYINVVSANTISSNIATGVSLYYTGQGSTVDFTGANVVSLGISKEIKVEGGPTVSGSNPDSYIQSVQIRDSEILLNGQDLIAGGPSEIDLNQAIVRNLGEVKKITIVPEKSSDGTGTAGTLYGTSLKINSTFYGTLTIQDGTHNFTGAVLLGGEYESSEYHSGIIHSSQITVNTGSYLVTNTSTIFASNDDANVAIGKFIEWSGPGSLRYPESSSGRLHIRRDFAADSNQKTVVNTFGDELVLEGNTSVGMTLISNTASNNNIYFGDDNTPDKGFLRYGNDNNRLTFGVNSSESVKIYPQNGGGLEIATEGHFESILGKLHIHQSNIDPTNALYINSDRGDSPAMTVVSSQTTANIINIDTDSLSSGSFLNMRYGSSTQNWIGSIIEMNDDNQTNDTRSLVVLNQNHEDATGVRLIDLYSKAGRGVYINQDADFYTLSIDAENSTKNTIDILVDNLTTGTGLHLSTTSDHTSNLVSLISDGSGTLGSSLYVKTSAINLGDTILVENNDGKLFNIESTGSVGVNLALINGIDVKIKDPNPTFSPARAHEVLLKTGDGTAFHTLHVGGTFGVEANSIFNGNEMRINSNVVQQNGNTTVMMLDTHGEGYAIFGLGENVTEFAGTNLWITYPGNDRQGYAYMGMGDIEFNAGPGNEHLNYRPERWAIEFNQYNSNMLFSGKLTVNNNAQFNDNVHIKDNITSNGNMTVDGVVSLADGSVYFESTGPQTSDGNFILKHPTTFLDTVSIEGPIATAEMSIGGDLEVSGNVVIQPPGPLHVNVYSFFINDAVFRDNVTIDDNLLTRKDATFTRNVNFSNALSTVTYKGDLDYDGLNVHITNVLSNTFVKGTSNFIGNTRFFAENVYINSTTSNTFTRGNFNVEGNVALNGSNTEITSNTNITQGYFYVQNTVSLVSTDNSGEIAITISKELDEDSGDTYGNTWITGVLTNYGNTHVTNNFSVAGTTTLTGNLNMANNDINANNIVIEHHATVKGNLNVSEGDILGSDDMTLKNHLTIENGRLTVSNSSSNNYFAGDVFVGGDSTIIGTLYVNDGDIVGDVNLDLQGNLDLEGFIDSHEQIETDSYFHSKGVGPANKNRIGLDTLIVTGNALSKHLYSNTWITGNTRISKDLTVNQKLFVGQKVTFNDDLKVQDVECANLTATGTFTLKGNVIANGVQVTTHNIDIDRGKLIVSNTSAISNFKGHLLVNGNTDIGGHINQTSGLHKLNLKGDTVSEGSAKFKKFINTESTIMSSGILTVKGTGVTKIGGTGGTFQVHPDNTSNTDGLITSDADHWVQHDLYVAGNVKIKGTIDAASVNYSSVTSSGNQTTTGYNSAKYFTATGTAYGENLSRFHEVSAHKLIVNTSITTATASVTGNMNVDGDFSANTSKSATLGATSVQSLNLNSGNVTSVNQISASTVNVSSGGSSTLRDATIEELDVSERSRIKDLYVDGDCHVTGEIGAGTGTTGLINCALPVYDSGGQLLNTISISIPS